MFVLPVLWISQGIEKERGGVDSVDKREVDLDRSCGCRSLSPHVSPPIVAWPAWTGDAMLYTFAYSSNKLEFLVLVYILERNYPKSTGPISCCLDPAKQHFRAGRVATWVKWKSR